MFLGKHSRACSPTALPEGFPRAKEVMLPEQNLAHDLNGCGVWLPSALREFKFTVKTTDLNKAEVETEWRREEGFEGGGTGSYGSEDVYQSLVIVSYDSSRNRINVQRKAQQLDFYINDWRDINPRRYHRDEDMEMQNVIMQYLEQSAESAEPEPEG